MTLAPADLIVAMTDGITEGLDNAGFDLRATLRAALAAHDGTPVPDLVCRGLMAASGKGLGIGGWHDDRTVVVLAVESDPLP